MPRNGHAFDSNLVWVVIGSAVARYGRRRRHGRCPAARPARGADLRLRRVRSRRRRTWPSTCARAASQYKFPDQVVAVGNLPTTRSGRSTTRADPPSRVNGYLAPAVPLRRCEVLSGPPANPRHTWLVAASHLCQAIGQCSTVRTGMSTSDDDRPRTGVVQQGTECRHAWSEGGQAHVCYQVSGHRMQLLRPRSLCSGR